MSNSDWSSDVCSSDLREWRLRGPPRARTTMHWGRSCPRDTQPAAACHPAIADGARAGQDAPTVNGREQPLGIVDLLGVVFGCASFWDRVCPFVFFSLVPFSLLFYFFLFFFFFF